MAKRLTLLVCLFTAFTRAYGQDTITRTDGTILKTTIIEVTPTLIHFRLFQQADTLLYQISIQDVKTIVKADGTVQNFATTSPNSLNSTPGQTSGFNYETQAGRNIIWLTPMDLVFTNLTLAYETISATGKWGFRIPVSFSVDEASERHYYDSFRENNLFGAGLELNYYPHRQGRHRFYFGPAFHFRNFRSYYYDYSSSNSELRKDTATMVAIAFKTGLYYHFTRRLLISADTGLGYRFFKVPRSLTSSGHHIPNRAYLPISFHIGTRF